MDRTSLLDLPTGPSHWTFPLDLPTVHAFQVQRKDEGDKVLALLDGREFVVILDERGAEVRFRLRELASPRV
jgi:hypothetical protein